MSPHTNPIHIILYLIHDIFNNINRFNSVCVAINTIIIINIIKMLRILTHMNRQSLRTPKKPKMSDGSIENARKFLIENMLPVYS